MCGKRSDWLHGLLAALSIGLSVMLKKNGMILFAAILILLAIRLFRKFSWSGLLTVLLCTLAIWGFPFAAQKQYEVRFDLDFGKGIPMSSWLAMGLNDSYIAPGWYDASYTVVNFSACDMNREAANERSLTEVRERLQFFASEKQKAREFFSEKIGSQWNEPSFQSIWTNQVRDRYGEQGWLASRICHSNEAQVKAFMNAALQFLYLLAAVGVLFLMRSRRIEDALLPTCIIGGFLYHALFEAKSQYLIPYLVLLLPLAAYGLSKLFACLANGVGGTVGGRKPKTESPEKANTEQVPDTWGQAAARGTHIALGFVTGGRRLGVLLNKQTQREPRKSEGTDLPQTHGNTPQTAQGEDRQPNLRK